MFPPRVEGDLDALWRDFGAGPEVSSRDRILLLTMLEVARVGPAAFNTRTICADLGLSHPVIQYHFGSRDGLIAEAAHLVYVRYVDQVWAAVGLAHRTPVDRLRAALTASVRSSREIRGWGAVLNFFPFYSESLAGLVAERCQQRHEQQYLRNMTLLVQLVLDVWADRITDLLLVDEPSAEGAAVMSVLTDPAARATITRLAFGLHGLSVWRAGHVLPAEAGDEAARATEDLADDLVASTVEQLIRDVMTGRPGPDRQ